MDAKEKAREIFDRLWNECTSSLDSEDAIHMQSFDYAYEKIIEALTLAKEEGAEAMKKKAKYTAEMACNLDASPNCKCTCGFKVAEAIESLTVDEGGV